MAHRILIIGLPGSGKTTLAQALNDILAQSGHSVTWLNADEIRKKYTDWDFTREGRIRQAGRMWLLSEQSASDYVIADFVAPLHEMRDQFQADFTIWVDTIAAGRFEDTNKIFEPPTKYDIKVTSQDAVRWSKLIAYHLAEHAVAR